MYDLVEEYARHGAGELVTGCNRTIATQLRGNCAVCPNKHLCNIRVSLTDVMALICKYAG
jgi:hypothetical protein